ncbi:uncharacterized protein C18orf19 homolog A [Musca vetustissima]|uniref:uncharacterized protein C18orf19 homolog A n=1 Tax=Musca vetustissima TaxID=27455 RepID=UPI002AB61A7D|nr:uncharacterized protein C18orf19 homolog A [Musca vetustissima]
MSGTPSVMSTPISIANTGITAQRLFTTTKCVKYVTTLPVPSNIDAAETTRFSPRRNRDISATAILAHKQSTASYTKHEGSQLLPDKNIGQDIHIQSYDCFGTINLNSAMQSNVPIPCRGTDAVSHLNMPRGQLAQQSKFISHTLHNSHYLTLRKDSRSGWSSYVTNSTLESKDPSNRNYCTKNYNNSELLTKKEQLKKAFKDYGSTIVIFHVTISLASLGGFYALISSGIDVTAIIDNFGYAPEALKNNVAKGASNFVVAYAIHKLFAPVRISITLGAAPLIVRYLRSKGFLKPKVSNKTK